MLNAKAHDDVSAMAELVNLSEMNQEKGQFY